MKDTRISLMAGFVAGVAEVLVGYPFDTVKTRLQIQDPTCTPAAQRTPWGCAAGIFREEGALAFYRGIAAPMIQEALGVALLFGAREWLRNNTGADITRPGAFILACCLIGLLESLIYCPLDHLKARMQALGQKERERTHSLPTTFPAAQPTVPTTAPRQRATAAHSDAKDVPLQWTGSKEEEKEGLLRGAMAKEGVGDLACVLLCGQAVIRARGVIGLYLGFFLQALKEMVGNIALFGTYDATLAALSGTTAKALQASGGHLLQGQSWLAIWPAGSLAGMAYYMLGYPLDTIKSKLQTDSLASPKYKGSLHCAMRVAFHETASVADLFRGLSMCLARAIPGCAIQFFVFEFVFKALTDLTTAVGENAVLVQSSPTKLHHWQVLDLLSGWS